MKKAYSIKENLPVETTSYNFGTDKDKSINQISLQTDDSLDLETMNNIVSILDEYLDSYQLRVDLERGSVNASIK